MTRALLAVLGEKGSVLEAEKERVVAAIDAALNSGELVAFCQAVARGCFGAVIQTKAERLLVAFRGAVYPEPVILRRTFEAGRHPAGSPQRAALNASVETSEYYPSEPYAVKVPFVMTDGSFHPTQPFQYRTFRTKRAASAELATCG